MVRIIGGDILGTVKEIGKDVVFTVTGTGDTQGIVGTPDTRTEVLWGTSDHSVLPVVGACLVVGAMALATVVAVMGIRK
jgi:hypothetical protein